MNLYITTKYNERVEIYSRPEEDFGYDYETFSSCDNIGDLYWQHTDSGLVNIDVMIEHLKELKEKGSNYVGCEWHCDHGEMELYGFSISKSSEEEIQKFLDEKKDKERRKKVEELRLLESKVENLKKSLEV